MIIRFIFIFLISITASSTVLGEDKIEFKAIRDILKNDFTEKERNKNIKNQNKIKNINKKNKKKHSAKVQSFIKNRYKIPDEDNFWTIMSELWLVKNFSIVKWNFKKPDFGIEKEFAKLLQKIGYFEKKYKILVVDSMDVYHMALPAGEEKIFLFSLPFLRALNLTPLEASILLLEDYIRDEMEFFQKTVGSKIPKGFIGSNFYGKKFDKKTIDELQKSYDNFILSRGYNFKQNFEAVQKVSDILKPYKVVWETYYQLIKKINELTKDNSMYSKYNKIFPSTELQIEWLKSSKKVL